MSSAVGYPTAVEVIGGPAGSLGPSRHCLTGVGIRQTTATVAAAAGCHTFVSPSPAKFSQGGRSTHIVWIPDAAVGVAHQLLAWVDLDRDGGYDRGEPYDIFASDFVSLTAPDSSAADYGLPEDFEIEVRSGSDRIGRGGQEIELRLRLVAPTGRLILRAGNEPIHETRLLADDPVGAFVSIGPSHTAHVMCVVAATATVPSPAPGNTCVTGPDGELVVRYHVPTSAVNLFRQQRDVVRVYLDRNRDGRHDHNPGQPGHEPSAATVDVRPDVAAASYAEVQKRMQGTVWVSGCGSWYLDVVERETPTIDWGTLPASRALDSSNSSGMGMWSDGATMWVMNQGDNIYAYNLADMTRNADRDITTLSAAGNHNGHGMWSNGATMWVSDPVDDKLYAYNLRTGARMSSSDIGTLDETPNDYAKGLWSNGDTIWVAD